MACINLHTSMMCVMPALDHEQFWCIDCQIAMPSGKAIFLWRDSNDKPSASRCVSVVCPLSGWSTHTNAEEHCKNKSVIFVARQ